MLEIKLSAAVGLMMIFALVLLFFYELGFATGFKGVKGKKLAGFFLVVAVGLHAILNIMMWMEPARLNESSLGVAIIVGVNLLIVASLPKVIARGRSDNEKIQLRQKEEE
jgi:hypothetical protein